MTHDVFISYASADKAAADAACAVLEQKGMRCWIAPRDIRPGDDWGETIIQAIGTARAFLLVFSGKANASQQVKREVERAVNRGLPVIPMRIEEVLPARSLEYFLSTPHWLDAFTPPLAQHLDYLAGIIRHILDGTPTPAPPPPPRRQSRRTLLLAGAAAATASAAAAFFLWPRDETAPASGAGPAARPTPSAEPSFAGTWRIEKLTVQDGAELTFGQSAITSAGDAFSRSAIAAHAVTGTFELNAMRQCTIALEAADEGGVVVQPRSPEGYIPLLFTSDQDGRQSKGMAVLTPYEEADQLIASMGGAPGDSALFITFTGYAQFNLIGRPSQAGSGLAALAGEWKAKDPSAFGLPMTRRLTIAADGRYAYAVSITDRGTWTAADGNWSIKRNNTMETSGTYAFEGNDRLTLASPAETMELRRS